MNTSQIVRTAASPVCSVCIANYNGAAFIESCIRSVLDQDVDFPVEILVHDDASTDGSAELVATSFPDVRLIRADHNVGFCVSNNRMVELARGKYVLLLNNDAALRPGALAALHNASSTLHGPHVLSLPQYDMTSGALLDIGSIYDLLLCPMPNRDDTRRDVGMVMGACMWLPRAFWQETGGFPEWFGSIGEDMLLCLQARLAGGVVLALPESGYDHHVGQSFGGGKVVEGRLQTTFRRRALSERNRAFVLFLCYPGISMYPMLALYLIALIFEGIALRVWLRDPRTWTAIYGACLTDLWRQRRTLRLERARIQRRRRCTLDQFFAGHSPTLYKLKMLLRHGRPHLTE